VTYIVVHTRRHVFGTTFWFVDTRIHTDTHRQTDMLKTIPALTTAADNYSNEISNQSLWKENLFRWTSGGAFTGAM